MTSVSPQVLLQPWYRAYPPFMIGGSLYAVPGHQRATAAATLAANQCRVHVDVIVDERGAHRGVTWSELTAVRDAAPYARLDLHIIAPDTLHPEPAAEMIDDVVKAARRFDAEAVTLNGARIAGHRAVLDALRRDGVKLWLELSPGAVRREAPVDIDGATVMFITPGTRDLADPTMLGEVTRVAARTSTAVDGGITEELAARCVANGARYVVAGRSLLATAAPILTVPTEGRFTHGPDQHRSA